MGSMMDAILISILINHAFLFYAQSGVKRLYVSVGVCRLAADIPIVGRRVGQRRLDPFIFDTAADFTFLTKPVLSVLLEYSLNHAREADKRNRDNGRRHQRDGQSLKCLRHIRNLKPRAHAREQHHGKHKA